MSPWKKIRYRLEWLALKFLIITIPCLPRRGAQMLSRGLGTLAYTFDKRGKNTAKENLTLIFGDEKSEDEIKTLAKESYCSFAQTVIDQFWSPRLNKDNYLKYCTVVIDDPEAVESALDTGAIWVTPHYANFEWIALMMGFRGYKFTIVAQDFKNKSLTEMYKKNREVSGHEVIPQRGALIRLLKNLKKGGHAAFLTDLTIRPSKAATIIKCFGKKTCVTSIHTQLMKRSGLKVIPGICLPQKDGTYILRGFKSLEFGPGDTDQSIAQACWDVFEPVIRENPAPWLWMYKHWRYIPEEGTDGYPSYVRPNEPFTNLEKRVKEKAEA